MDDYVFLLYHFCAYLLDNRIDKYCSKEYNLNIKEAYEKALNEFRKEYGISWQEIEKMLFGCCDTSSGLDNRRF